MAASVVSFRVLSSRFFSSNFRCTSLKPLCHRTISASATRWAVSDGDFQSAKDRLNSLQNDPGNETKLKIYALFKQATEGKCTASKPGAFDFVKKAKWSAWNDLGDLSQDDAKQQYVDLVMELAKAEGADASSSPSESDVQGSGDILYSVSDGVCNITLNRPNKKNAITREMYKEITDMLDRAGKDRNVNVCVFTGAGEFYSSGNDLSMFTTIDMDKIGETAEKGGVLLEDFVNAFIDFPKPLIAAVNGPAVGIAVTTLGIFDVVYAVDNATFKTPFAALGQSPEGCSSYIFPKVMGNAKANEVLLFGKKLTAQEALACGFITDVFPRDQFKTKVDELTKAYGSLPKNALQQSKNLIRQFEKEQLYAVNKAECKLLVDLWQGPECAEAVMNFFMRKSK